MDKLTPILRPPANNGTGFYRMALPGIIDVSYPNSKLRRARVQDNGKVCGAVTCGAQYCFVWIEDENVQDNISASIRKAPQDRNI